MDKVPDNLTHEEELRFIDYQRVKIGKKFFELNKHLKHVRIKNFEVELVRVKKVENHIPFWMFWKRWGRGETT